MKKAVLPLLFCFLWTMAIGQINCLSYNLPVPPSDDCDAAPPFCASYLDGYCSSNAGYSTNAPGNLSNVFGCSIENNQWLTFVPCESTVSFTLSVGNCGFGGGMEFAVFETSDCLNFDAKTTCFQVSNGQTSTMMVSGLQIGFNYYLMVDGVNGDTCTWKIDSLIGVSQGGVLQENNTPGHINGPSTVCSNITATYSAIAPVCGIEPASPNNPNCPPNLDFTCPPAPQKFSDPFVDTLYNPIGWDTVWHITPFGNGYFINNDSIGSTVQIQWFGSGTLHAEIIAVEFDTIIFLNDGIEYCNIICPDPDPCIILPLDVNVNFPPSPPLIVGPNQICEGQSVTFFAYSNSTFESITWISPNGESLILIPNNGVFVPSASSGQYCAYTANSCGASPPTCLNVVLNYILVNLANLQLCQDELPYDFYGQTVTTSGNYEVVYTSWQGCDSIVSQQITVLPPVSVSITSSTGNSIPIGSSTTLDAGAGFASYLWSDGSTGQTLVTDQPGSYTVTVTSTAGCTGTASITLTQVFPACANFNVPVPPSDSCSTAPPFCASYLNGYCSSNTGFTPDTAGNLNTVIPCTIENNQWLSFVACADSAELVLDVKSCAGAMGLEFFVLQTVDCQIFTAKTACHEIFDGMTDTLHLTNLTAGETYYLMVDGIGGDVCNWGILSSLGISDGTTFQEDNTPGQVTGPTALCAGSTATYTFTSPICDLIPVGGCPGAFQQFCTTNLDTCNIVQYDTIWHVTPFGTAFVNNDSMGLSVMVVFPDSVNVPPDSSVVFTISVELVPIPDTTTCCLSTCATILPDTEPCGILPLQVTVGNPQNTSEIQTVCPGDCVGFYGEIFCQPGTFTVTDTSSFGCINTHELTLDWIVEQPPVIVGLTENCNASGTEYTVSFDVVASGNVVTVNDQPLNGTNYSSSPIPSGQAYSFILEQVGQCQIFTEEISGSVTCPPCIGGAFDLGTMSFCPSESFTLLGNTYSTPGSYSETLLNPATNCLETYNFIIEQIIENQLVVGPTTEFCDASNLYYYVGFSITSGNPPYFVNGNPIPGNTYQSGLIPSGQAYAFTVTDAAICNPQSSNISGSYTCACLNSPGTVNLSTINKCEGDMANASFNNNAILGPGDIQVFILHTSASTSLGSVIGTNTTGSFGYVSGMMNFGQTYYISPAVGPDQGGSVDVSSSCFSIAPGQPVVFYEKPNAEIVPPGMLSCTLNSLMLNGLASGGSGNFSYNWSGPNNFTSTLANPTVGEPGAYLLTLTDNLTACQDQAATAVTSDNAPPVFTVTNSEINCQQPATILVAASQMPGVTYTWTFPTGDVMAGDTIFTSIPGDYTVVALGPNGCTADAATFVTDNGAPPSITATGDTLNCSFPLGELTVSSNEPLATFTWTLPDTTSSTGSTLTTNLVGIYTVVATAPNGCSNETTTAVVQGTDPVLETEVEVMNPSCHGFSDGSITVKNTTGGTAPYEYVLNDSLMGDTFPNLSAGDYVLTTTDANGCTGQVSIQLVDPPAVSVQIGDDQYISLGQSVTLSMQASITPDSITWYGPNGEVWPDVNSLTVTPAESGRYFIVISDISACRSSDTTYVYVNGQGKVFIPNVFSPNGDGQNDFLTIFGGGDITQVLEFQVFDRWGEMVFEAKNFLPNDLTHGWDGRHKGKAMDPAVFVVKAMVLFRDGTKKMVKGDVVLMR